MALQSKSLSANGSKGHHKFTLNVVEESTSIENNTSLISFSLRLIPIQSGWDWSGWSSKISYSVNIGGNTYNGTISSYDGSSTITLKEGSFNIEHNGDGKKSIAISFSISDTTGANYTCGNASASGSVELTTIPRASDLAVPNTDLGQNIPITIGKKVDSFTSTLSYTIGSLTGTIVEKTSLSNYPWVMTSTLINQIKNAYPNSGSYASGGIEAKITCKTYNGTTLIGTKEATFKLYITDKPTISNVVRTELNSKISALTTSVLRHASQNKFTITTTAPIGATIASYRVKNGTQDSGLSTSNVVNLNDIQTYYTENSSLKTKFVITCVDSRGNESEEYSLVCDFINYVQVSINKTDVAIKRTSNVSTDCKIYVTGNFFNGKIGSTSNVITLKCRYKKKETTTWGSWITITTTSADNTFKADNVSISGTFDYKENYDFEITTTDKIGESDNYSKVFVSSIPTELHHKNGAWIRELKFEKADIFPIGTLFMSLTSTNPSECFFGTWELYAKGKTLVGYDEDDIDFNEIGKTGGEKMHTLTIDETPAHTHTMFASDGQRNGDNGNDWEKQGINVSSKTTATTSTGGGQAHNNLQPYIVCYIWRRVS